MFTKFMEYSQIESYSEMLEAMSRLSRLSSESPVPNLGYREVENMFCIAFEADNLSRSDCSVDAAKNNVGIGIKTFRNGNGRTLQKIAEFNKDADSYRGKTQKEVVEIISNLRNERLRFTMRTHDLNSMIYHCVVREEGKVKVFECPMDEIDIKNIKNVKSGTKNTITFEDGKNEYSINLSKSTLYKRFITDNVFIDISVSIIDNPYIAIKEMLKNRMNYELVAKPENCVFLPLFSDKGGRHVPEKSGLNQWNAGGRERNPNEVYIPIPAWVNKAFPDFFPARDQAFDLILPDGKTLSAKICQDGRKALMSNPNLAIGKWLLRTVMNLKEGELLTYEKLEELGLDSVAVYKEDENVYSVNFTEIGSYDAFRDENQ